MSSRQPLKPFRYRVTKYDSHFRDEAGVYLRDEWTAASDVGRVFEGELLTPEAYLRMEDAYVAAVQLLLVASQQPALTMSGLELYCPTTADWLPVMSRPIIGNELTFTGPELTAVVRLILREELWGELLGDQCSVSFGYDYYMYFSTIKRLSAETLARMQQLGLYVD